MSIKTKRTLCDLNILKVAEEDNKYMVFVDEDKNPHNDLPDLQKEQLETNARLITDDNENLDEMTDDEHLDYLINMAENEHYGFHLE